MKLEDRRRKERREINEMLDEASMMQLMLVKRTLQGMLAKS